MNNQQANNKKSPMAICMLCLALVICLGSLALGITLIAITQRKMSTYIRATAIVIDYEIRNNDDDKTYAEIAEFTVDGKTYTVTNKVSSTSPAKIGKEVEIAYNPDNPDECIFVGSNNFFNYGITILSSIITAIVLTVLIIESIKYHKIRTNKATPDYTQYTDENKIIL